MLYKHNKRVERVLYHLLQVNSKILTKITVGLILTSDQLMYIKRNIIKNLYCSFSKSDHSFYLYGIKENSKTKMLLTRKQQMWLLQKLQLTKTKLVINKLFVIGRSLIKAEIALVTTKINN